jgi:hypothetical protein
MAYNVLKGAVEGSVDQHADQEIDGIKVFKSTISASVFYDTDAQSPCATLKDVAISEVIGTTKNGVLTLNGDNTARAHHNLTYDGKLLKVAHVSAATYTGSGIGLVDLPPNNFTGLIPADNLKIGPGLQVVRGSLQPKVGGALQNGEQGLSINLGVNGGISVKDNKLTLDASKSPSITHGGQNLSDQDTILVGDADRIGIWHTTLSNLYDNYVSNKIPHPAGAPSEIQFKGKRGFSSSPKLSYCTDKEALKVEGKVIATAAFIEGELKCTGAVIQNISKITSKTYEVGPTDYTLICDSIKNSMTITLPPACNNTGRVLNIKKVNTDKYNLRSYPIRIKTTEGTIDINDEIILKTNYASRNLQSDGENWWIIGSKGT